MSLNIVKVPAKDDRVSSINDGLNDYNEDYIPDDLKAEHFAFIVEDEKGNFLGGAKCKIFARWMHIVWLYSTQEVAGTGTTLMERIEEHANKERCIGITLDTFEFQAPEFYKRFGFVECGHIPNYIDQYRNIYMYKRLRGDA